MPELPDVEVFRRYLNATSLHKRIASAEARGKQVLKGVSASRLERTLKDARLQKTRRHGKHLFVRLDRNGWLVLHFGMTGFLRAYKHASKAPEHVRLLLCFDDGYHLAYDCQRRLGELHLAGSPDRFVRDHSIGPDALAPALDFGAFRGAVGGSRGAIKPALMNQKRLAGVGNVYADEILFQARVHPEEEAAGLAERRLGRIYRTMREDVLPTAVRCKADPQRFPHRFLTPRREAGARCPRCSGRIEAAKVSGRTAYFCPACQNRSSGSDGAAARR